MIKKEKKISIGQQLSGAIIHNHISELMVLLSKNGPKINHDNNNAWHYAAQHNLRESILELLFKYDVDMFTFNNSGSMPIALAFNNPIGSLRKKRMLNIYLKNGFNINDFVTKKQETLLHLSLLYSNANHGGMDVLQELVELGLDINMQNEYGNTGLHCAVHTKDINYVRYILEKGGNINIKNQQGLTPIDLARQHGNYDIICLMEKYIIIQDIQNTNNTSFKSSNSMKI